MFPRPLYRWKSFWLGVLVLAFMGWAWVRSKDQVETIKGFGHGYGILAEQGPPGISIYLGERPSFVTPGFDLWRRPSYESKAKWFTRAFHWEPTPNWKIHYPTYSASNFQIAHWLVILCFLIPWIAFLFWHGHRMKKRMAAGG